VGTNLQIMAKIHTKFKAEYPRTETLKIRISKEHLDLLNDMQKAGVEKSKSDIICRALEKLGLTGTHKGCFKIEESKQ
jgi:hypothetical protein